MWTAALRLGAATCVAVGMMLPAQQTPVSPSPAIASPTGNAQVAAPTADSTTVGGKIHGVVKSGAIPLPGVAVTAQNTLTGKRYSTTTDITGAWSLTIPQNGRYVVRTQFAAFAQGSQEALLNATGHDQKLDFSLILASRVAQQEQQEAGQTAQITQAIRQLAGSGTQSLNLMNALTSDTETQAGGGGASGAALPSAAGNADFSSESVAISGQAGAVSPLAGVDMDRIRDAIESFRQQNPGMFAQGGPGGQPGSGGVMVLNGGGPGGGGFMMGGGGFEGGFGGLGGGFGGGGGRGGFGNFRGFNPGQPHGAIFWMGSNSALNAEPFSLRGQSQEQPASGSNRFGLTFISAPYIPGLTKPSGKDNVFLTLSGQRSSTPLDEYATVPTDAEKGGDFSATGQPTIYDPTTLAQFTSNGTANVIPSNRIAQQATSLLAYFPAPNLPGTVQNYHLLSTQQSNTTQAGARYMRSLGANSSPFGFGGRGSGARRAQQNQGLRQSINFNYNWSHSASDSVNIFPQLGGKTSSDSSSLQAGYTVGYHRLTSLSNLGWNRSNSHTTNFFTNQTDIADQLGITVPSGESTAATPINYGLPNIDLSNIQGLSEQQPSFSIGQTISVSETLSWIHGKHNLRFGGDYRRVHRDFLAGSNATGSFTFTGLFTQDAAGDAATGNPFADFLLGYPQETTLDSVTSKNYLRDNVFDVYAQDDWRVLPGLTLNYGVRYEFFAPYTDKYGHLGEVLTNPAEQFTSQTQVTSGQNGLPAGLVHPYRTAFAPRLGIAWRVPKIKSMVVRGGYGMNYTTGAYATFATMMAHQPPFANEQTNEEADANGTPTSACARGGSVTCTTLANGFPAAATLGNYALDPHFQLPYVQVWNADIQKTLPWGIVMNVGYNGAKGSNLDIVTAPRAIASSPLTDPTNLLFRYESASASSRFSAGTLRVNKRMTKGIAVGANYQYAHSIDDAGALGSVGGVGAQNWSDIEAEEGNSSLDQRHKVSGTYVYELPFGADKTWVTGGTGGKILEGLSVSGSFTFATGTPLTPAYAAQITSVACGTGGTFRPNLTGASVTEGGGTLKQWFNPGAFSEPVSTTGNLYPCGVFGNAPRNFIAGPGTISNNMSLSKTMQLGDTRSMEIRATLNNAFNTVQYSGVDTNVASPTFGQVTSVASMRSFQFMARFRF
ncbi:MAG TPA: TonB-dependent receptor [Terracidiphilus sp.]|nr:TonB-dependent receptor [Terracidiphilus sp.]